MFMLCVLSSHLSPSLAHVEAKHSLGRVEAEELHFEVPVVLDGDAGKVDGQLERPAVADVGQVGGYRLARHLRQVQAPASEGVLRLRRSLSAAIGS